MSDRTLIRPEHRTLIRADGRALAAPALIVKRKVLFYRGLWNGPDDFHGRLLVQGRADVLKWVDIRDLFDGEWDGHAITAMFGINHLVGFGVIGNAVVPGSQTYTASGSDVVGDYNRREASVWGAGGKGGGADSGGGATDGGTGGNSTYATGTALVGNGGQGGHRNINSGGTAAASTGGTATGGTANVSGSSGSARVSTAAGAGGQAGSSSGTLLGTLTGGAGAPQHDDSLAGSAGSTPGGGGSGGDDGGANNCGGGGAGGGLSVRLWNFGDAGAPSGTITVTVAGTNSTNGTGAKAGGNGARGEIRVQWD